MKQQPDCAYSSLSAARVRSWTSPSHLRLRLLSFCLYAIVYWAIIIAVLVRLHASPLLIEGSRQHVVDAPSAFTVGTLTFIIAIISSILTLGLAHTAKGVLQMDFALRFQTGLPARKLDRTWSALAGSLLGLPNRYTLVLINAALGAAILNSQFGVYTTRSSKTVSLNVTGANLDQVAPYYRGESSDFSWFYNAMAASDLKTYHAKFDDAQSFSRLDEIYNSLARPADKFSHGNRGGLVYQHETAFGAPKDVANYAPFYGDMTDDDAKVTTCAQTFARDAVQCKWYTDDSGAISNLKISTSNDGATFELNDPDLGPDGQGMSLRISQAADTAIKELPSGDFAVIFASLYSSDRLSLSKVGEFPGTLASGVVSGRCLVKRDPFRFSPVSWQRIGTSDVALTAPYDADAGSCRGPPAELNELLPDNNATSVGQVIAEHVAALLVPPEQDGRSLGWLLKSRLKSTLEAAYEYENVLTYVVRGLIAAGMVAPTARTDTNAMSAQVEAVQYSSSFGVQGDAWVLVLLALPALSTGIALFFAIKLFFGTKPVMKPGNLFELTKLVLAPRTRGCAEYDGSGDEKGMMVQWMQDQACIDCRAASETDVQLSHPA